MKSRTNQLDPRILGGLRAVIMPNDVLDEKQVTHYPLQLQGMVGYAAECLMDFQDLGTDPSRHLFRIVEVKRGSPFPFRCRVVGHPDAEGDFSFFLPASQVAAYANGADEKEPKARPFTITEFNERFKLGSSVHFAEKDGSYECHAIYTGYYYIDGPEVRVGLGGILYKLQDLFDWYKLAIAYVKKDDREEPIWGVFGVDSWLKETRQNVH